MIQYFKCIFQHCQKSMCGQKKARGRNKRLKGVVENCAKTCLPYNLVLDWALSINKFLRCAFYFDVLRESQAFVVIKPERIKLQISLEIIFIWEGNFIFMQLDVGINYPTSNVIFNVYTLILTLCVVHNSSQGKWIF